MHRLVAWQTDDHEADSVQEQHQELEALRASIGARRRAAEHGVGGDTCKRGKHACRFPALPRGKGAGVVECASVPPFGQFNSTREGSSFGRATSCYA